MDLTIRNKIIEIAKSQIGIKESPHGSNIQKYGEWYGMNGLAWCAMFVSWVFNEAGSPLGHVDDDNGFRYCPSALIFWKKHKNITDSPFMGDIVIFDWNNDDKPDHTGIFLHWVDKSKGIFETIEGNTSASSQSNGGEVQMRTRKNREGVTFVNVL